MKTHSSPPFLTITGFVTWHWFWRIARIFVGCLVAAVALGSFSTAMSRLRFDQTEFIRQAIENNFPSYSGSSHNQGESEFSIADESTSQQPYQPQQSAEKKITIISNKADLQAVIELKFEKNNPLYNDLIKLIVRAKTENNGVSAYNLSSSAGKVVVNTQLLNFQIENLEINDQTGQAYFKFVSNRISADLILKQDIKTDLVRIDIYSDNLPIYWDTITVNINTADSEVKVIPEDVVPARQSAESTTFEINANVTAFRLDLLYPSLPAQNDEKPLSSFVQTLNEGLPLINSLLIGALYSLPFLLFATLYRRKNKEIVESPAFIHFSEVASLLLILYIGLALLDFTTQIARLIQQGLYSESTGWITGRFTYYGNPPAGALMLMAVFPTLIWPGMVRLWEQKAQNEAITKNFEFIETPRRWISIILAILAIGLGIFFTGIIFNDTRNGAGVYEAFWRSDNYLNETVTNPVVHLIVGWVFVSVVWIMYELYGHFVWLKTIFIFLALIALSFIWQSLHIFWSVTFFTIIISLPFIYACIRLGYFFATTKFFRVEKKKWPLYLRFLIMIGLVALLIFLLIESKENSNVSNLVINLSYAVGRLGIFALLFVLIRILQQYAESHKSWGIPDNVIEVGVVLTLSFLFLPSQQWMFVLIVFLTAYLLLKKWFFISLENKKFGLGRESGIVRSVIQERISLNDCGRGIRTLRKELLGKFGKGDITFEDYDAEIKKLEETIESKKQALSKKSLTYHDLMMLGGTDSPWQRGRRGAMYGLIFSLPWMVLNVLNLKKALIPAINFEILSVLTTVTLSMLRWPLQGFIFGYFYPHIRGKDGIRKGLNFFLLLFIPIFIATVFAQETTTKVWDVFLLYSLQLFIHSMLLGLIAGDYETLRRSGLSWRHLAEVHNLSSLTIWGTSVVVAFCTAITTMVTSGAAGLITIGVKALLPDLPDISPKK